jgi:DNA repair exonuclease SbcCD ATPase subunit
MDIEFIIHISDIHIRLQSRKEEYEEVFKKLYKRIDNYENKNGLIVITGDIFHDKTNLSPEAIKLSLDLFEELSRRYCTILIQGNHDGLLNIEQRMDNISGVLFKKEIKNLHYLKKSGIYQFNNILFGLSSLYDNKLVKSEELDEYIIENNLKNVIKIGLYHGMVGTIELEGLYKINGKYSVRDFEGYNLCLLGDVHKYQYLNSDKTIGYASSLISQNFSETDEYHGYLYWDLKDNTSHYEIIKNDYRYKICNLKNGKLTIDKKEFNIKDEGELIQLGDSIPELGQVKIIIEEDENNENLKYLKSKFKKVRWTESYQNIIKNKKENSRIIENLNIDLKELIDDCIYKNHNIHIEEEKINFIYNDIITKIKNKDKNFQTWNLEKIKFKNLCIYGGEEEIDLTELRRNEIILISGNNNVGKSTIIDIICFILYNKMAREMNIGKKIAQEIININKKEGYGEIYIFYGDKRYIFRKEFTRNNVNKITVKPYIYEQRGDEKILLLNSSDKVNEMIENIFGKFEDFIFMNIMLQFDNIPFRSMKQMERKDLLNRLLDLEKYEKLEDTIKPIYKKIEEEYNNINNIMKDINPQILEEEIKDNNIVLKNVKEKLENINKNKILEQIDELNKRYININDDKEENNKRIIENKIKNDQSELELIKLKKYKNIEERNHLFITEDKKIEIYKELEILNLKKRSKYEIKKNVSIEILKNKLIKIDEKEESYNEIKIKYEEIQEEFIKCEEEYKRLNKLKKTDILKLESKKYYEEKEEELRRDLLNKQLEYEEIKSKLVEIKAYILKEKEEDIEKKIENYRKDKKEQERLKEEYENNERIYKEYENHEFNPSCNQCMKNPITIELLRIKNNINDITIKIEKIKLEEEMNNRMGTYEEKKEESNLLSVYINKLMEEIIKINNEINEKNEIIKEYILEDDIKNVNNKLTIIREEKEKVNQKKIEFENLNENRMDIEYQLELIEKNNEIEVHNKELDIKIKELKEKENQYEKYRKVCNEIMKNDIDIKDIENSLIKNGNELEKIKKNENCKELNNNILNEIGKLKLEYKILEKENIELEKEKYKIENNNELIQSKLELYNQKKEEYNNIKKERDIYYYYMELLHKNGLSLSIIKKYLEFIEVGVNNIIEYFIEKRVKLSIDNNSINLNICVEDEKENSCNILMLGGRETFIFDIAFKIVLSKIGELPRSNFLFIDEGISVFDTNNLNGIGELFNYLNLNYEHVFLISHLEQVKDMVNKIIYIKNDGIGSKIEMNI